REAGRAGLACVLERATDGGAELWRVERLLQERGDADARAPVFDLGRTGHRDQPDARARDLADAVHELAPAEHRHPKIEDDDVRLEGEHTLEPDGAVRRVSNLELCPQ